ncbi:MAG: hypothetical protein ABI689_17765 [Thermoanaerobaculia bacterium]
MSRSFGLWRRRIWIWLPPAVALTAATLYLVSLQRGVRSQGANLEARLEAAQREHGQAQAAVTRLEKLDAAAQATRTQMARFMEEKFATEGGRFTSLVREIKQLAEHAGLDPREIGYPEEAYADLGLVRRSFIFSVQGSYVNLRAFLYLLELSPSYVTVDEIEVRELAGAKGLGVNLRLSTFFAAPPPATSAAPPASGGNS